MRALVLLWSVLVAIAPAAAAGVHPVAGCTQIVQRLNNGAANVNQNATAYWSHRAEFVDLIFGLSSATVGNAMQVAEQHQAQGNALRAGIPTIMANFKNLIALAQTQNCLSASQLAVIVEPTIKLAKRVNFDQFPQERPLESTVEIQPPRLPH